MIKALIAESHNYYLTFAQKKELITLIKSFKIRGKVTNQMGKKDLDINHFGSVFIALDPANWGTKDIKLGNLDSDQRER